MSALKPSRPVIYLLLLSALFLGSALALSACENTYKGVGRDIGSEEMADGFDK